jgi:hypothetical protein
LKQGRWPIRGKRRATIISEIIQGGIGKIFFLKKKTDSDRALPPPQSKN